MSTNSPLRPLSEGQISVFDSPHAAGVLLVDRAETNAYGSLRWAALHLDDPVAMKAIADHQALSILPVLKRALKNPSTIVLSFCDGANQSFGRADASELALPVGGNTNGWWSNGAYLMHRSTAVALRDNDKKQLLVNSQHLLAFRRSWIVVGMKVELIEYFQ
jgi:hypothetical protein